MQGLKVNIRRSHEGVKPYQCDHCNSTFDRNYDLRRRVKNVHERKVEVRCDICNVTYRGRGALKIHTTMKHTVPIRVNQESPGLRPLTIPKPYECTTCGTAFIWHCELETHMKEAHCVNSKNARREGVFLRFSCQLCDEKFILENELKEHTSLLHLKGLKVEKEDEDEDVKGHFPLVSSTEELNGEELADWFGWLMQQCVLNFATLITNVFPCQTPRKKLPSNEIIVIDVICIKLNDGLKKFPPGRQFCSNPRHNYLSRRLNRELKPYVCPKCQAAFTWHTELELHARTLHGILRHFVCRDCSRSFVTTASLTAHICMKHRCELCYHDWH
ncbi:putative zinc finger protein [Echinococcus granulosus]|nr:putative zinc finger protein [Echinococcus granulosus]